ncbi:hypothetical protein GV794_02995 [Nocardia cyriacigeorgica]|uniref:Uncharacterized protein n=1 Tax=Nocardia cyriacigeorgica TaxID=135487 RepID=A0A6P1D2F6_9NOCA|nr:hypothetical protein [Nocardia cyriacigeorgica]NEW39395.1 hypothetical protein [Nocardia cyriacigeorgica]NEW43684.1 hypothetical protein [Nocardia cyriacigeorgica]NEW54635.1 hypothetical protein [Nocardia cyriacigeorgica]
MSTAISEIDTAAVEDGESDGAVGARAGLVCEGEEGHAARGSLPDALHGGRRESVTAVRVRPARGARTIRGAIYRPADRRPRGAGPRAGVVRYDSRPVRRAPSGYATRPEERVERAQVGFAVLAISALLSALVVTVLIGIAHLRAEAVVPQHHPDGPVIVEPAPMPAGGLSGVPR